MSIFRTILVPTDFSKNASAALATAAALSAELGSTLRVAFVGSAGAVRDAIKAGLLSREDDDETLAKKVRAAHVANMEAFLAPLGSSANGVESVFLSGDASREIVAYCREHDVDLIVMGRRGITLGDVMLGSVAARVVRHAPCPVMIVRGG